MNNQWKQFLQQQGLLLQEGKNPHFSHPTSELVTTSNGNVLCNLDCYARLRITGEDAQAFLQNLLSNDIRQVSATRAQYSSLNSAKGRVLATLFICQDDDGYLLQLPTSLSASIHKKLAMYVLRAKVKIIDASDEIIALGVSGKNAQLALSALFGAIPENQLDSIQNEQASLIKVDATRYQINIRARDAAALWTALAPSFTPVGSACWNWLEIRAGIPAVTMPTQEQFVAQMINLDVIDAVNFKKGCYPGQEIVARMQYLGKLKRRMYLVHGESADVPQAGVELFSADLPGQATGMMVNASPSPEGGFDGLAVVQISSRETTHVHLGSSDGAILEFRPLPYSEQMNSKMD